MLNIKIVCIGQLAQLYWNLAAQDYLTRLSKRVNIEVKNISEYKSKLIATSVKFESEMISKHINKNSDYQWLLLDLTGKLVTSKELSQIIINNQNYHQGKIGFIIGGSNGVSSILKTNPSLNKIAFGKITFPHQLCYIILLEQIYRALQIINNQPYHK